MTKAEIREKIWTKLEHAGAGRFPGVTGRVPNFAGADQLVMLGEFGVTYFHSLPSDKKFNGPLELNVYYIATDLNMTSADIVDTQVELVAEVKSAIKIPLAVKISPFVTSIPNFAKRLVDAGADGLVLFNRFYQPDFDLDELEIVHSLDLSTSSDLRLPLRWISILYGKIDSDFALTSGVHSYTDVLKAMMSGAKVAMMASNLRHNGEQAVGPMLNDLKTWMQEREYESIQQMQGSMSQKSVKEPAAFERANYMKVLNSFRTFS